MILGRYIRHIYLQQNHRFGSRRDAVLTQFLFGKNLPVTSIWMSNACILEMEGRHRLVPNGTRKTLNSNGKYAKCGVFQKKELMHYVNYCVHMRKTNYSIYIVYNLDLIDNTHQRIPSTFHPKSKGG